VQQLELIRVGDTGRERWRSVRIVARSTHSWQREDESDEGILAIEIFKPEDVFQLHSSQPNIHALNSYIPLRKSYQGASRSVP
jgi:hypothetical protein